MREKRYRTPSLVKSLITLNPNKRLRGWIPPAPGWNLRRIILEVCSSGDWTTSVAIRRQYPAIPSRTFPYHFRHLVQGGYLEKRPIEGRPARARFSEVDATGEIICGDPRMRVRRQKARNAYRITHAGLAELEGLRAGRRDILGRSRSRHYAILREWMPGRGEVPIGAIRARLGAGAWKKVVPWCWHNYGNPRPVAPGLWEWHEWTVEELFS